MVELSLGSVAVAGGTVFFTSFLWVVLLPVLGLGKRLDHNEAAAIKAMEEHLKSLASQEEADSDSSAPKRPIMGIILYSFIFSPAQKDKNNSKGGDKKNGNTIIPHRGSSFVDKIEFLARAHNIPYAVLPTLQNGKKNGKLPRAVIMTASPGSSDIHKVEIEDSNAIIKHVLEKIGVTKKAAAEGTTDVATEYDTATAMSVAMHSLCEDSLYWNIVEERWRYNPTFFFDHFFNLVLPIKSEMVRWCVFEYVIKKDILAALRGQGISRYADKDIAARYLASVKAIAALLRTHVFENAKGGQKFQSLDTIPGPADFATYSILRGVRDVSHLKQCDARDFCKSNATIAAYMTNMDQALFPAPQSFVFVAKEDDKAGQSHKKSTDMYMEDLMLRRGAKPFDAVGFLPPLDTSSNSGSSEESSWTSLQITNMA